jgi:hypothetical protein
MVLAESLGMAPNRSRVAPTEHDADLDNVTDLPLRSSDLAAGDSADADLRAGQP